MISEASLLEQSLDRAAFVCEGKTVRFLGFSKQETATLELVLRSLTLDKRSAKGAYYVAIEPYWGHQSSTSPKGLLNLVNGHQRGSRLAFEGMGPLRFDFVPSMLAEALPNLTLAIKLYKKSMWGGHSSMNSVHSSMNSMHCSMHSMHIGMHSMHSSMNVSRNSTHIGMKDMHCSTNSARISTNSN